MRLDANTKFINFVETEKMKRLMAHATSVKSKVIGQLSEDWIVEATKPQGAAEGGGKLRLYNIKTKEEKLLPGVDEILGVSVTPAPDQKHSLVFTISNTTAYFVVDSEGNVVDKVDGFMGQFPPLPK
ncbi:MAG: hypothetical protein ACI9G1_001872 [Pirellulaceae bacterium]|jgi:hypothetical protein